MEFVVGQKIDRYIVEGRIGEGGMAEVYKCRHESLNTFHAIKVVKVSKEEIKQRMIREGQLQATLSHNNIVRVTDILPIQGHPCLVMDFIEGQALDDFLSEHRIGIGQAEEIFLKIIDAMSYAHDRSIIHRDLKPANILMELHNGQWTPKVADFGLAKAIGAEDSGMTRTGMGIGTPAYMAPEQVRNAKGVDHRADIFSLGTILYEMVTGQLPFKGNDTLELLNAVASRPHRDPTDLFPQLPERMADAINACLVKDPERRIQNCEDLRVVFLGEKKFTFNQPRHETLAFDGSDPFTSNYHTVDNLKVPPPSGLSQETIQYDSRDLVDAKQKVSGVSTPSSSPIHSQNTISNANLHQQSNPNIQNKPEMTSHSSPPIVPQKKLPYWMMVIVIVFAGIVGLILFAPDGNMVISFEDSTPEAQQQQVVETVEEELAPYAFLPFAIVAEGSSNKSYPHYVLDEDPNTAWEAAYSKEPSLILTLDSTARYVKFAIAFDDDEKKTLPNTIQFSVLDDQESILFGKRMAYSSSEDLIVDLGEKTAFQDIRLNFNGGKKSSDSLKIYALTVYLDTEQAKNAVSVNRQTLDDSLRELKEKKPVKPTVKPPTVIPAVPVIDQQQEPPEPTSEPEPPAPTPQATTAKVQMTGADQIRLLSSNQSLGTGTIPPGTYTIEAVFGERTVSTGSHTFQAGKDYLIRCDNFSKRCQVNQQ